jgi:DNA modification methylase
MINTIIQGDALEALRQLENDSIDCCITSPPYWNLRNYNVDGQVGLEQTPQDYIKNIVAIFREIKRSLKPTGTCWLNVGDSYISAKSRKSSRAHSIAKYRGEPLQNRSDLKGHEVYKNKDLGLIPHRLAIALQEDGWYIRSDIIWAKTNPMPESVKDRPSKAHEHLFLLTKSENYYYNIDAVRKPHKASSLARRKRAWNGNRDAGKIEASFTNLKIERSCHPLGRNLRDVWHIPVSSFRGAHFATFPTAIVEPCIMAGCPENGIVLDPFMGAGTTALVAKSLDRKYVGIELNPDYIKIAERRLEIS